MFNERTLENFASKYGTKVVVENVDEGWHGRISDGEETVAEATTARLDDLPCALAADFRSRLSGVDEKAAGIPRCQSAALEAGIPGVARMRGRKPPDRENRGAPDVHDYFPDRG